MFYNILTREPLCVCVCVCVFIRIFRFSKQSFGNVAAFRSFFRFVWFVKDNRLWGMGSIPSLHSGVAEQAVSSIKYI